MAMRPRKISEVHIMKDYIKLLRAGGFGSLNMCGDSNCLIYVDDCLKLFSVARRVIPAPPLWALITIM